MDEIQSRGKVPILVGGTHYYTQSLLFRDALSAESALSMSENNQSFPILEESTETILSKLKEVDPTMADRWHPNERRKIQRSLEIFLKTGKPASQIYNEQRTRREPSPNGTDGDSTSSTTGMRFPTLVLWVHASKDVLYTRLDGRVDKMVSKGLLQEVETLAKFKEKHEVETGMTVDQSRGIWVSIGYKEFVKYQQALTDQAASLNELELLKTEGIERTQAATRQYANRQLKWIRIKLLNALIGASQQGNVFLLDSTDLSKWRESVVQPALRVTERFLSGQTLPDPSSLSPMAAELLTPKRSYDLGQRPDLWQKRTCETCGTVAVTENDWSLHIKSRAHRRAVGIEKKQKSNKDLDRVNRQVLQADLVDVLEDYMQAFPNDKVDDKA
jgi:tRNA dimethylallyltransferase